MSFTPKFGRRDNPDGSFASMCLNCFETVATASDPQTLFVEESQHNCWKDSRQAKGKSGEDQQRH